MTFSINGTDILQYVTNDGLSWERVDQEGPAAGTSITRRPIRDRVSEQFKWSFSCMPLTAANLADLLTLINPQYVTATYTDPETNVTTVDTQAFVNTAGIKFKRLLIDGVEHFAGLTFTVYTYKDTP